MKIVSPLLLLAYFYLIAYVVGLGRQHEKEFNFLHSMSDSGLVKDYS